jgi:hypothetical protein
MEMLETVRINRGPIRSFKLPAKMPPAPMTKKASEDAPDTMARDHPNIDISLPQ